MQSCLSVCMYLRMFLCTCVYMHIGLCMSMLRFKEGWYVYGYGVCSYLASEWRRKLREGGGEGKTGEADEVRELRL